ncbi:hypothetical protein D3C72_678530 [compost metagenome]
MSIHAPTTLQLKLRAATQPGHTRLEERLDLLGKAMTVERYRLLLGRFYGVYQPLEAQLAAASDWPALGYDFDERRKVERLVGDLTDLGMTAEEVEELPRCRDLPHSHNLASADTFERLDAWLVPLESEGE